MSLARDVEGTRNSSDKEHPNVPTGGGWYYHMAYVHSEKHSSRHTCDVSS